LLIKCFENNTLTKANQRRFERMSYTERTILLRDLKFCWIQIWK